MTKDQWNNLRVNDTVAYYNYIYKIGKVQREEELNILFAKDDNSPLVSEYFESFIIVHDLEIHKLLYF